jgi:hypothetical protein
LEGELVGTPSGSRQNVNDLNFQGLPFRLSEFEVYLGVKKGMKKLRVIVSDL